jgi:hypothetical protein
MAGATAGARCSTRSTDVSPARSAMLQVVWGRRYHLCGYMVVRCYFLLVHLNLKLII